MGNTQGLQSVLGQGNFSGCRFSNRDDSEGVSGKPNEARETEVKSRGKDGVKYGGIVVLKSELASRVLLVAPLLMTITRNH